MSNSRLPDSLYHIIPITSLFKFHCNSVQFQYQKMERKLLFDDVRIIKEMAFKNESKS